MRKPTTSHHQRPSHRGIGCGLIGLVGLSAMACPSASDPDRNPAFDGTAMLTGIADNVVLETLNGFELKMETLTADVQAWDSAIGSDDEAAALEQAKSSFRAAMAQWQRTEVFQIGPAAPSYVIGGADYRDEIYSWHDQVIPCAVDQKTVDGSLFMGDASIENFDDVLTPAKGLDALEYLLFVEGTDNDCSATATINRSGSWDALGAEEIQSRRARYAAHLSTSLNQKAVSLCQTWEASGGNFRGDFIGGTGAFSSQYEAIDSIYAGMLYLDTRTKDLKLKLPLGLHMDCAAESCPEKAEHPWSGLSRIAIAENLHGFRALFTGVDGYGFDDALRAVDAGDLADRMIENTDRAIEIAEEDDRSIAELVRNDPATATSLYDAIKLITDDMKTQLVTALNLSVPNEGAGDND